MFPRVILTHQGEIIYVLDTREYVFPSYLLRLPIMIMGHNADQSFFGLEGLIH